jgi:hypothetical protein
MQDFEMIRAATNIEISTNVNHGTGQITGVSIAVKSQSGKVYQHTFGPKSKEVKSAFFHGMEGLRRHFVGGAYFFVGDKLCDYKPCSPGKDRYTGFIHTDEALVKLAEELGIEVATTRKSVSQNLVESRTRNTNGIMLGKASSDFSMNIDALGEGGQFNNRIIHKWSPFSDLIDNVIEAIRLICTNGMTAESELFTKSVRIVNEIEDNLRTVFNQIQPTYTDVMSKRFIEMSQTPTTVAFLQAITRLLESRLKDIESGYTTENGIVVPLSGLSIQEVDDQATKIRNLIMAIDPSIMLEGYYDESVFTTSHLAQTAPGHISQYDALNVITELNTHYAGDELSSRSADRLANSLMFDEITQGRRLQMPDRATEIHTNRAFIGQGNAADRNIDDGLSR